MTPIPTPGGTPVVELGRSAGGSLGGHYQAFLDRKKRAHKPDGFQVETKSYPMFDFQHHTTQWAGETGRACVFAGTGLGKTRIQVAWAEQAARANDKPTLILSPLAVAGQTIQEAAAMGVEVSRDRGSRIQIANYERLHECTDDYGAIVLDESSILKSYDGATRKLITDRFSHTPHKLALSATPAPNDYMELGTHAEFMGAMTRLEMLATYFTHDGGDTSKWRLKKHARRDFWKWVSTWAICFNNPSDIGFDGSKYILPELHLHEHVLGMASDGLGGLFGDQLGTSATEIHSTQARTRSERISKALEIESQSDSPIILWCSTNEEQLELKRALPGAVSVIGSDSPEFKEWALLGFSKGEFKTLITKPSIAGFGMNWQHCNRMAFVTLSYSYEMLHQAIRRCYRFGQTRPVNVHLLYSEHDNAVRQSLEFKSQAHLSMLDEMRAYAN